jgi:hypothetical protein
MTIDRKLGEYAVAATAFFVSVCSLFIYIYQSKLMSEQQQVAVWPYVQWSHTNLDEYRLDAHNKGVGPALVRKVAMSFNGKAVRSNQELMTAVMGADSTLDWQNGGLEGAVLSAGEKVSFLIVPGKEGGEAFAKKFNNGSFTLEITYCSIYGRCWISSGFSAKRAPDDEKIDY